MGWKPLSIQTRRKQVDLNQDERALLSHFHILSSKKRYLHGMSLEAIAKNHRTEVCVDSLKPGAQSLVEKGYLKYNGGLYLLTSEGIDAQSLYIPDESREKRTYGQKTRYNKSYKLTTIANKNRPKY
jgi:hypothetical protein